jgi:carbon starvation protein CstA
LLLYAPKRIYAFCTFLPFAFTLVTTFTAGVLSIQMWWRTEETDPTKRFLLLLACALAAILLVLTAIITVDSVRRWLGILAGAKTPGKAAGSEAA